ncbi:MAG: hypothetical protein ACXADH_12785 [Candidatus Kariarchaeaceae archaeon]|jgi:hypothetical protein
MPWVGFDFDGTLAKEHTFEPVLPMVRRLRTYLKNGTECRILTARGNDPHGIALVKNWLREQDLPNLEVTSKKDYQMIVLYDDRARQVIQDTGEVVGEEKPLRAGEIILPQKKKIITNED